MAMSAVVLSASLTLFKSDREKESREARGGDRLQGRGEVEEMWK